LTMDVNKVPKFQSKLESIRASLLGDVAKTIKTSQEEFEGLVADLTDDASRNSHRQMMLNLGQADWEKLKLVEEALENIKNGNYGICQKCEKNIPDARLKVVPFAKYCVACLEDIEKEKELNNSSNINPTN